MVLSDRIQTEWEAGMINHTTYILWTDMLKT